MVKDAIGCKSNLVSRGNVDQILGSELRNVSIAVLNRCSFHRWCSFTYRSQLEPVFLIKIMLVVTPLLGQGEKSSEDTVALEVHCLGLDSDFDRDEVHAGEVCSIIDTAGTFIASNPWIGTEGTGSGSYVVARVSRVSFLSARSHNCTRLNPSFNPVFKVCLPIDSSAACSTPTMTHTRDHIKLIEGFCSVRSHSAQYFVVVLDRHKSASSWIGPAVIVDDLGFQPPEVRVDCIAPE